MHCQKCILLLSSFPTCCKFRRFTSPHADSMPKRTRRSERCFNFARRTFGSHSTELSITAKWHMKTWYSENAILQKRNFSEPAVSDQNINAIRQAQDVLFFSTTPQNVRRYCRASQCKKLKHPDTLCETGCFIPRGIAKKLDVFF